MSSRVGPWQGRLLGSMVVLALATAGCSSATNPVGSEGSSFKDQGNPSSQDPDMPSTSAKPATGQPGRPGGATPPAGVATTAAKPPSEQAAKNWAPLFVELNGNCFDRGDTIEARARSVPEADFAFTVAYSQPEDGDKIPPDFVYLDGEANPSGEVTWRVVVRPTVEYGPAVFKTVVKTPEGKGAFDSKDLRISKDCA
ncbi:MAG: hypothetical protein ACLGH3_04655 [Actinomycetota bacterium]